jgi:peroxiredoxin
MKRRDKRNRLIGVVAMLMLIFGTGCERYPSGRSTADDPTGGRTVAVEGDGVEFLDQVESNREDDGSLSDLEFVDTNGQRVGIRQFNGKKNLVLVFTRGFSGALCPYCTTQTSRLIANYEKFRERDAEVLLVYPGSKEQLPQFQQAGLAASGEDRFPFPVLLDEDLAAVKKLGIVAQLASPSTFILDRDGKVRLSYVGSNPADRPSIQAMLDHLDRIRSGG